ncbi:putative tRNA (guanine-N(7)-)-methyltransferase [Leishmania major strain Friedlin]|uniref:tRNA (guanine-N(7)-)-methyltransferase n=1 Tax=Leishmania major TaxID=5664 RepID=E9AFZ6_LEIMA|nr:putative tRNA (guanine-N(7)-)-methyltransferase [Leishmania major strain Friedlin]CAG9582879.1 tRNA_(guanine-N(7)-)-methyltransferase_-_putative [Leishmania major strain Friedlin]CBZ13151.1 putative tRNA (guanine-N(7)-)-methyltransferase [Leishmania major strain Friedlin]|eukprot:XP_003722916.1 putative tRNA (guanine-N(7)-)-methyltransferase [Leishmania major strain Friedlin]
MASEEQPRWTRLPIRTRPHRNPLAENDDEHPECPAQFERRFSEFYPGMVNPVVEFVDVGCAFGGMLFSLAAVFPATCMMGLEIRPKVVSFAQEKALALRQENAASLTQHYRNVWFEQMNVMKFGSNCFTKGQLSRLFFCYPDPHWKRKNIRRRIISPGLVQEYAYWLRHGGLVYTVSDVAELEEWMVQCLDDSPLFRRLAEAELCTPEHKQVLEIVTGASEDAQRTARKGLQKHFAVHMRI